MHQCDYLERDTICLTGSQWRVHFLKHSVCSSFQLEYCNCNVGGHSCWDWNEISSTRLLRAYETVHRSSPHCMLLFYCTLYAWDTLQLLLCLPKLFTIYSNFIFDLYAYINLWGRLGSSRIGSPPVIRGNRIRLAFCVWYILSRSGLGWVVFFLYHLFLLILVKCLTVKTTLKMT